MESGELSQTYIAYVALVQSVQEKNNTLRMFHAEYNQCQNDKEKEILADQIYIASVLSLVVWCDLLSKLDDLFDENMAKTVREKNIQSMEEIFDILSKLSHEEQPI